MFLSDGLVLFLGITGVLGGDGDGLSWWMALQFVPPGWAVRVPKDSDLGSLGEIFLFDSRVEYCKVSR